MGGEGNSQAEGVLGDWCLFLTQNSQTLGAHLALWWGMGVLQLKASPGGKNILPPLLPHTLTGPLVCTDVGLELRLSSVFSNLNQQ